MRARERKGFFRYGWRDSLFYWRNIQVPTNLLRESIPYFAVTWHNRGLPILRIIIDRMFAPFSQQGTLMLFKMT